MVIVLWAVGLNGLIVIVYRIADARYPLFDGGGAQLIGGRWNSPGRKVIYTASTFAGALLEVLVHANTGRIPRHHQYISIDIPSNVDTETFEVKRFPDWGKAGLTVSRAYGDEWYDNGRALILKVPSVVTQVEYNLLINQNHPDFTALSASDPRPVNWDSRLFPRI